MSGFVVNSVGLEDIDQIVAITRCSGLSRWSEDDYKNEIGRSDAIFRKCCDRSGKVIGFIVGRTIPATTGGVAPDAEIYNLAVDAEFRRLGVGSIVLEDFFRECMVVGVKTIWLEVRFGNEAAKQLYKCFGFSEISIRRSFYSDPFEDAIIMNRIL